MATEQLKLTGGSSPYYGVRIEKPTSGGDPYTAECNDIIESLNLNFAEGNILKALWRIAKDRMGEGKPGNPPLYDAEKVKFFGDRVLVQQTHKVERAKLAEDMVKAATTLNAQEVPTEGRKAHFPETEELSSWASRGGATVDGGGCDL